MFPKVLLIKTRHDYIRTFVIKDSRDMLTTDSAGQVQLLYSLTSHLFVM